MLPYRKGESSTHTRAKPSVRDAKERERIANHNGGMGSGLNKEHNIKLQTIKKTIFCHILKYLR